MSYASNTSVSEDRSRLQIERMVLQYGAKDYCTMIRETEGLIGFTYNKYKIQMSVPFPDRNDEKFKVSPGGRKRRSEKQAFAEWEKEVRRRWRSLCLVIKGKLVGVEDGVTTFEKAFLSDILIGGQTVSERVLPKLAEFIEAGKDLELVKMLPAM